MPDPTDPRTAGRERNTQILLLWTALAVSCGAPVPAAKAGLQASVERAADLEGVPRQLLLAITWVDSRLSMRGGEPSLDLAYGLSHLVDRDDAPAALSLARAARLTGQDPALLRTDALANARGGAALLREQAALLFAAYPDLHEERLSDWYQAVMRVSGSEVAVVADGFAQQVYAVLQGGLDAIDDEGGEVHLAPQQIDLLGRALFIDRGASGEYCPGGACVRYVPAAATNQAAGRGTSTIDLVVIHDMEGTYSNTIAWFQNPASQVSAHFDLRSSDGQITQQVMDADTAWHSGNHDVNTRAIGIEHEGYAAQGTQWYTEAMYQSSAALTRWLCDTYAIPKDRQHIIGHYEVPDPNHSGWYGGKSHHHDPCGVWSGDPTWHNVSVCYWDWTHYLHLITSGGGPGAAIANGGFEQGLTGWKVAGAASVSKSAHGGFTAAMVGRASPSADSAVSQTFTVPAAGGALSFWYQSVCADKVKHDWASATLTDAGTGRVTTLLNPVCNNDGAWHHVTSGRLAGGTVFALKLASHDDGHAGDPTYTLYDDVTLQ